MPADWSRPHWSRSDEHALIWYFVFGGFAQTLQFDLGAHGGAGLPAGVSMRRVPKAALTQWDGHPLRGALGEVLRADDPPAFAAADAASECVMLHGELADPATLDYLRDTLGVIAALLDAGGAVVVDPQVFSILDADRWRREFTGDARAVPRNHVLILHQDDVDGRAWVRTRGMRKFARPDLSLRGVPPEDVQRAGALTAHLVELEARGMRFGAGSVIELEGVADGLAVQPAGAPDDPHFNNAHLEIRWPAV